jgi:catechol 2,3-dioxygenase-like lactoylglutathione lyase family enzyme
LAEAQMPADIEVLFVVGFGPIVKDVSANVALFRDTLGLPVNAWSEQPDYFTTSKVDGVKNFAMWPLYRAAQSCFGRPAWPADLPAPTAWIEFDVADIEAAGRTLKAQGYRLLASSGAPQTALSLIFPAPAAICAPIRACEMAC